MNQDLEGKSDPPSIRSDENRTNNVLKRPRVPIELCADGSYDEFVKTVFKERKFDSEPIAAQQASSTLPSRLFDDEICLTQCTFCNCRILSSTMIDHLVVCNPMAFLEKPKSSLPQQSQQPQSTAVLPTDSTNKTTLPTLPTNNSINKTTQLFAVSGPTDSSTIHTTTTTANKKTIVQEEQRLTNTTTTTTSSSSNTMVNYSKKNITPLSPDQQAFYDQNLRIRRKNNQNLPPLTTGPSTFILGSPPTNVQDKSKATTVKGTIILESPPTNVQGKSKATAIATTPKSTTVASPSTNVQGKTNTAIATTPKSTTMASPNVQSKATTIILESPRKATANPIVKSTVGQSKDTAVASSLTNVQGKGTTVILESPPTNVQGKSNVQGKDSTANPIVKSTVASSPQIKNTTTVASPLTNVQGNATTATISSVKGTIISESPPTNVQGKGTTATVKSTAVASSLTNVQGKANTATIPSVQRSTVSSPPPAICGRKASNSEMERPEEEWKRNVIKASSSDASPNRKVSTVKSTVASSPNVQGGKANTATIPSVQRSTVSSPRPKTLVRRAEMERPEEWRRNVIKASLLDAKSNPSDRVNKKPQEADDDSNESPAFRRLTARDEYFGGKPVEPVKSPSTTNQVSTPTTERRIESLNKMNDGTHNRQKQTTSTPTTPVVEKRTIVQTNSPYQQQQQQKPHMASTYQRYTQQQPAQSIVYQPTYSYSRPSLTSPYSQMVANSPGGYMVTSQPQPIFFSYLQSFPTTTHLQQPTVQRTQQPIVAPPSPLSSDGGDDCDDDDDDFDESDPGSLFTERK